MSDILIVGANFYKDIAEQLSSGVVKVLSDKRLSVESIWVPGVFEIPSAVAKAWSTQNYLGVISLGCVIRGQTDHYDHICREVIRELMELTVKQSMPHGLGILTCENYEQAWERAHTKNLDVGGRAALACCRMLEIHKKINDGSV